MTEIEEKGKVRRACDYMVLGIDLERRKDIYGFLHLFGSENQATWLSISKP